MVTQHSSSCAVLTFPGGIMLGEGKHSLNCVHLGICHKTELQVKNKNPWGISVSPHLFLKR